MATTVVLEPRACTCKTAPAGLWKGAIFHTWGMEESEDGSYSVAIVEIEDSGDIKTVLPEWVRFKPEK